MNRFLLMIFLLILLSVPLFSQVPAVDYYNFDFKSLSKLKVVSATKSEQTLDQIPSTVVIVSGAKIEERGYQTLDEVLADLPGFQFRNQLGLNSYVFQRGISSQNNLMLVMIDGIQVNELNSGGFYGGGQYNLANIDHIEVVYGPASVTYGTNAVSGIVNLITRKADQSSGVLRMTGGNFNTLKSDFALNLFDQSGNRGLRISGLVRKTDLARLSGADGDYNWSSLMENFENDYALDIKANSGKWVFGTNFMLKQTSTSTLEKTVGTRFKDFGTFWNISFINNYLKYVTSFQEKLRLTSTLYNRNTTVLPNTIYCVTDSSQTGYFRPNNLLGFEQVIDYKSGSLFSVTSGFKIENELLSKSFSKTESQSMYEKPPVPSRPDMENNLLFSVFAEPRFSLFNFLFLSGGLRYDQSSVYHQVFTPKLGANLVFDKWWGRMMYAEAFRAPKPWDYTDGMGNLQLQPERMRSLEVAMSWLPVHQLKFDVVAYFNKLKNGFIKQYQGDNYQWINHSVIRTTGAEFSARYISPKAEAAISYTLNSSIDSLGHQIPEIARHTANALFSWSCSPRFKINLRANFSGSRKNCKVIQTTGKQEIEPYFLLNGAASYQMFRKLSVQVTGTNLLNSEYYHPSNRSPDRYRQPQRQVLLSLNYLLSD